MKHSPDAYILPPTGRASAPRARAIYTIDTACIYDKSYRIYSNSLEYTWYNVLFIYFLSRVMGVRTE